MMGRQFVLAVLSLMLACCAHMEKPEVAKVPKTLSQPAIPSPTAYQVEVEKKADAIGLEEYYTFSLREADVKDVLRGIAKETNYNVVIEPDVKGMCTVDLKNVTLPKALEYILEPLEFTYKIDGRTIYVSKPKLETKVFNVNYVSLRKFGTSSIVGDTASAGGTGSTGGTTGAVSTAGATPGATGAVSGAAGGGRAVQLMTISESDMWKTLADNVKSFLSKDGQFAINSQAFAVAVTDYPKHIRNVGMFLRAIEKNVQKQVMIETKIIDIALNKTNREGVNWRLIGAQINGLTFGANQVFLKTPSLLPVGPTDLTPSGTAVADSYFRFFVGAKHLDMDNTFIDLLKTQGTVKIVSSPKITALNNQRAVIKVARQDVYFEQQQSSGSVGAGNIVTFTPKFITEGLILDVIPQIDDEGNILLNIHPMLTEKVSEVANPAGGTVPILDVRETDTMVRIREGETVIIGGLIQDQKIDNSTGVSGLMNLPGLGWIFRAKNESVTRNELVISLTPRIIYDRDGK